MTSSMPASRAALAMAVLASLLAVATAVRPSLHGASMMGGGRLRGLRQSHAAAAASTLGSSSALKAAWAPSGAARAAAQLRRRMQQQETVAATAAPTSTPTAAVLDCMTTITNCSCQEDAWSYAGVLSPPGCANPNLDERGAWCFTKGACQGLPYGYCRPECDASQRGAAQQQQQGQQRPEEEQPAAAAAPVEITAATRCNYTVTGCKCSSPCTNPSADPAGPWCSTEQYCDEQGDFWGFCDWTCGPEGQQQQQGGRAEGEGEEPLAVAQQQQAQHEAQPQQGAQQGAQQQQAALSLVEQRAQQVQQQARAAYELGGACAVTREGCGCVVGLWDVGPSGLIKGCGNPDADPQGAWCPTERPECGGGSGWGYCAAGCGGRTGAAAADTNESTPATVATAAAK